MTESEWLASDSPARMLDCCEGKASDRKLLKIACAARWTEGSYEWDRGCGWDDWDRDEDIPCLGDDWPPIRYAKLFLDRYAPSTERSVNAGPGIIRDIIGNHFRPVYWSDDPKMHAEPAPRKSPHPFTVPHVEMRRVWLTPTVLALAQAAYDERQPDGMLDHLRLAVLADALEEAGCDNSDGVCPECNGSGMLGTLGGKIGCYVCAPDYQTRGTGRSNRRLLRCRCGGNYAVVRKKSFPVPLSSCLKCWAEGPLWEDVLRGEVIPHPILAHLRSPGPHWRGCWAVDLVLGKE